MESYRVAWFERDLKAHPVPTPCNGQGCLHQIRLQRAPSNLALNSEKGHPQLLWAACYSASLPSELNYFS